MPKKYNVVIKCTSYEYFDDIEARSAHEAINKIRDLRDHYNLQITCDEEPEWQATAYRADECVDHEHLTEEF